MRMSGSTAKAGHKRLQYEKSHDNPDVAPGWGRDPICCPERRGREPGGLDLAGGPVIA